MNHPRLIVAALIGSVGGALLLALVALLASSGDDEVLKAVPTALIAILALAIGHLLTGNREQERWVRDRRLDALAELSESSYVMTLASTQQTERNRAQQRMIAAMVKVELLASPQVVKLSPRLIGRAYEYDAARTAGTNIDAAHRAFIDLWHDFNRASRSDLGVEDPWPESSKT